MTVGREEAAIQSLQLFHKRPKECIELLRFLRPRDNHTRQNVVYFDPLFRGKVEVNEDNRSSLMVTLIGKSSVI
jgi:hypothetical protein